MRLAGIAVSPDGEDSRVELTVLDGFREQVYVYTGKIDTSVVTRQDGFLRVTVEVHPVARKRDGPESNVSPGRFER